VRPITHLALATAAGAFLLATLRARLRRASMQSAEFAMDMVLILIVTAALVYGFGLIMGWWTL
jgi:VIT1/CCC1 family predicted Fe2+/Mn2+ transporter